MTHEELLTRWHRTLRRCEVEHQMAARYYEKLNWRFGIPATVLAAVVGASIFAGLEDSPLLIGQMFAGSLSLLSAALVAVQTFMNFEGRAAKHREAAQDFGRLAKSIQQARTCGFGGKEPQDFVESIRLAWSEAEKIAPSLRHSIIKAIAVDPDGADPVSLYKIKRMKTRRAAA